MSKSNYSFYKYLVEELITSYFQEHKPEAGMKYYVLFENEEHRKGLFDAFSGNSTSRQITISGIFENRKEWMPSDEYDTFYFVPNADGVKILIGNESDADNGYLTTLRNAVGDESKKYKDFALLNILKDNKLESITTSGLNLMEEGGPLHQDMVLKNMLQKLDNVTILEYDKLCLKRFAESIKERISKKEADLFVFEDILAVLQNSTVKLNGSYHKFGYFPDKYCSTPSLITLGEKDMKQRINNNASHFERIKSILNSYYTEALTELNKTYDESLSSKIVKNLDTWMEIDYSEIEKSIQKKAEKANYKYIDLYLNANHPAEIIKREEGSAKRKKVFCIISDASSYETTSIRIDFNKNISNNYSIHELTYKDQRQTNYRITGSYAVIEVGDRPIKFEVGKENNRFTFFFLRLKTTKGTFEFIRPYFSITAKANVTIKAPEDLDYIEIGNGPNEYEYTGSITAIKWQLDNKIKVDLGTYSEGVEMPISFSGRTVVFNIVVDEKRIVPVKPQKVTEEVWGSKKPATFPGGKKVRIGSNEYNVDGKFYGFLELEKNMAEDKSYCLKKNTNSFGEYKYESVLLNLPEIVKNRIDAIFDYFSTKKQVPTLTYIDDELETLYKSYIESVHSVVASIESGKTMSEEIHSLTKLGTIEDGDNVMFTPYHPLLIAYMLEYKNRYKGEKFDNPKVLTLISPFYLIPYISYGNKEMQPYCDDFTDDLKTWLFYEKVGSNQQIRTYNITTKMVTTKIKEFKQHFDYLFQVKDSPIIISTVGIYDDTNVVKGLFEYVKAEMKTTDDDSIQRIEVHEYVKNIEKETFFEKLNRLNSEELIIRELNNIEVSLEMGDKETSPLQVIRQFFTRIDFYKHDINECNNQIEYCHIAFYQMETGLDFPKSPTSILRNELSFNGLISIPSTCNKDGKTYTVGFGTKGISSDLYKYGEIYPIAIDMNSLYANEKSYWASSYSPNTCLAKSYVFKDDALLQSIYEKANWVTFLNPEVDIDFFYRQKNLYVIHYTDQYTINAKYDSITVTQQTEQYNHMLSGFYDSVISNSAIKDSFMKTMMNYFNSLNGDWLLSIINKSEVQVREKMSIVSACILMRRFLSRKENVVWIPVSLEEILRVTGNIGLEQESLFSKKTLGVKGAMSDDLLMIGIEEDEGKIMLYYYPVEVKASATTTFVQKASEQVVKTYRVLENTLMSDGGFVNDVYRTFFASQLLTSTEKLRANDLISDKEYEFIDSCRFRLLNLDYTISKSMIVKELGYAATVAFAGLTAPEITLSITDDTPVCNITVSLNNCSAYICDNDAESIKQLLNTPIILSTEAKEFFANHGSPNPQPLVDTTTLITNGQDSINTGNDLIAQDPAPADNVSSSTNQSQPTLPIVTNDNVETDNHQLNVILGYAKYSNNPMLFEANNPRVVSHPNFGIIGTMGTGKTQLVRSIIAQMSKETMHNVGGKPIGMLIFDYKNDYADDEFLEIIGGTNSYYNLPFNPLKLIVTERNRMQNLPAITAERIADSLAKSFGAGTVQQAKMKQVIIETYEEFGITRDSSTWEKTPPTINDVITRYLDKYDATDSVYAHFSSLSNYQIFASNPEECVSIIEWLDRPRVISLNDISADSVKRVVVSLILDVFNTEMLLLGGSKTDSSGRRQLRAMIVVDEAHQFLQKDFYALSQILRQGRMFGVGMLLSTQSISDFKTKNEDYTQQIASWALHHVNSISRSELVSIFGASDSHIDNYMEVINRAQLFECLCKIGSRVDAIRDLPFFELMKNDDRFKD